MTPEQSRGQAYGDRGGSIHHVLKVAEKDRYDEYGHIGRRKKLLESWTMRGMSQAEIIAFGGGRGRKPKPS
jgi:hypothetical protein